MLLCNLMKSFTIYFGRAWEVLELESSADRNFFGNQNGVFVTPASKKQGEGDGFLFKA